MKKTQHEKIIDFCKDGEWHCGNEFRANFIFSPHKRRAEITESGMYYFTDKKCEHGHKNVLDYKMHLNEQKYRKVDYYVPALNKHIIKIEAIIN